MVLKAKVFKTHHFLVILFSRLSLLYCMVKVLYNCVLLNLSPQLHIQGYHSGSLKLAIVGVLTS